MRMLPLSLNQIPRYYKHWIEYAVRYAINDAVTQTPPMDEGELMMQLDRVFLAVKRAAEGEVNSRLTALKPQILWYRGFVRQYAPSIAVSTAFFAAVRTVILGVEYALKMGSKGLNLVLSRDAAFVVADKVEVIDTILRKWRILLHPMKMAPRVIKWIVESLRAAGITAAGTAAATQAAGGAFVRGVASLAGRAPFLAGAAAVIISLLTFSIRCEAPTMDSRQWNEWKDTPEADALREEAQTVVDAAELLQLRITALGGSADDNAFAAVLAGEQFTVFENEREQIFDAIAALTIPSVGPEATQYLREALLQELQAIDIAVESNVEVSASGEPDDPLSESDMGMFVNNADVLEILMPEIDELIGDREDLTDEEINNIVAIAASRKDEELREYGETAAQKVREIRGIAAEAPTDVDAAESALEALQFLESLFVGNSTDEMSYQLVSTQMQSALPMLPMEMRPKAEEAVLACTQILGVFNE